MLIFSSLRSLSRPLSYRSQLSMIYYWQYQSSISSSSSLSTASPSSSCSCSTRSSQCLTHQLMSSIFPTKFYFTLVHIAISLLYDLIWLQLLWSSFLIYATLHFFLLSSHSMSSFRSSTTQNQSNVGHLPTALSSWVSSLYLLIYF